MGRTRLVLVSCVPALSVLHPYLSSLASVPSCPWFSRVSSRSSYLVISVPVMRIISVVRAYSRAMWAFYVGYGSDLARTFHCSGCLDT